MEHQDAKRRSNRALVRFYSAARSRPATTQEGGGCVRARKRSQQLRETHGRPGMGRWLSTSDRRTTLPRRVAGRRQPVCSSGTAAGTVVGCGCLRGQKVPTTRSQRDRSAPPPHPHPHPPPHPPPPTSKQAAAPAAPSRPWKGCCGISPWRGCIGCVCIGMACSFVGSVAYDNGY